MSASGIDMEGVTPYMHPGAQENAARDSAVDDPSASAAVPQLRIDESLKDIDLDAILASVSGTSNDGGDRKREDGEGTAAVPIDDNDVIVDINIDDSADAEGRKRETNPVGTPVFNSPGDVGRSSSAMSAKAHISPADIGKSTRPKKKKSPHSIAKGRTRPISAPRGRYSSARGAMANVDDSTIADSDDDDSDDDIIIDRSKFKQQRAEEIMAKAKS